MPINQLGQEAVPPVLSTPLECAYPEPAEPLIPIFRQDLGLVPPATPIQRVYVNRGADPRSDFRQPTTKVNHAS